LDGIADHDLRALVGECLSKDPADRPTPRQVIARFAAQGDAATMRLANGWRPADLDDAGTPADAGHPPAKSVPARETGHLIITRASAEPLSARAFIVLIDGDKAGVVADGATARFTVDRGEHTVQVRSGEFESAQRTVVVAESSTLKTKPTGGLGQPITGLELSPAASSSGSSSGSSGVGFLVVAAAILALLYWKNTGFADYVTDNWHWAATGRLTTAARLLLAGPMATQARSCALPAGKTPLGPVPRLPGALTLKSLRNGHAVPVASHTSTAGTSSTPRYFVAEQ
jgi:hypothetical protein